MVLLCFTGEGSKADFSLYFSGFGVFDFSYIMIIVHDVSSHTRERFGFEDCA